MTFVLPWFFNTPEIKADPKAYAELKKEWDGLKENEPSGKPPPVSDWHESKYERSDYLKEPAATTPVKLFYFDPNLATADQWRQLGLRDKTIRTILHFISKGGSFRRPGDLEKIYGLREEDCRRLEPFVKIEAGKKEDNLGFSKRNDSSERFVHRANRFDAKQDALIDKININTADSVEFMKLRGIGSKLASRIIHFRERLGGFYSVEQVGETYALPDSVFQKIKANLVAGNDAPRQMDMNLVTVDVLKQHPYIRWNLANAIVQYRQQHGRFGKKEDLLALSVVDSSLYRKISPYLEVKE